MKKIVVLLLSLTFLQMSKAQLNINFVLSATPPSALTDWNNKKEVLSLFVSPAQGVQLTYKIKTEIKLTDGTVIGRTDLARSATYTASSTNTIFYAGDVIPLENMIFTGKYKTGLERTGKLLSDNYQICVRLVRPSDYSPVSEERCRSIYLASLQLPILLKPSNEEVLNATVANQVITFRWSPVVPRQTLPVRYRLNVMEVLENQSAMQAFRSNQPILSKEIRGTTQFIWQVQGIINCCSTPLAADSIVVPIQSNNPSTPSNLAAGSFKKYVWTIQTLDNQSLPMGDGNINGDGVSEPAIFYVSKHSK